LAQLRHDQETAAMPDDDELDDLRWHWGRAYNIAHPAHDRWIATRRDGQGTLRAADPEALREAIREDYAARPVRRV
jgi:hypothetical protein